MEKGTVITNGKIFDLATLLLISMSVTIATGIIATQFVGLENKRNSGDVIKSIVLTSAISCCTECKTTTSCATVNVGPQTEDGRMCELLSDNITAVHLQEEDGWSHWYPGQCVLFKADDRDQVGSLNSAPGPWMHVFPDLKLPVTGRLSNITFYAARAGSAFVSFWRQISDSHFELRAKAVVTALEEGLHHQEFSGSNIMLEAGNSVGVHYDPSHGRYSGVIMYETDDGGDETPGVSVYNIFSANLQDDGWETGTVLTLPLSTRKKNAALHIEICP